MEPLAQDRQDRQDRRDRVVCIRPGALGDTLLALPALALLRRGYPAARLIYIGRRDALALIHASGLADRVYPYDLPDWGDLFAAEPQATALARETFTHAVVVAWLRDEDALVATNLRCLGAAEAVVASPRPAEGEGIHAALLAVRALGPLGIAVPTSVAELLPLLPRITPSSDELADAAAAWSPLLAHGSGPVVALHPGSGGAEKRWPAEAFAGLVETLAARGMRPLLIEGPQDAEVVRAVLGCLSASDTPAQVVRDLAPGALAALLRRCAGYAGNDSGVSHLAALLGVPAVVLFGPTSPAQWAPLGPRVAVVRAPSGRMRDLAVADVAVTMHALLAAGHG